MTMKHNIAVIDPSGKISDLIFSISADLDAAVHGFRSSGEFAEAINHRMQVVDDLAMVVICIVHVSADHPGFRSAASLAGQLKKHSTLSSVPVLVIGPDKEVFTDTFGNLCSSYVQMPVKKSILLAAVSSVISNPAPVETEVQQLSGTVPVEETSDAPGQDYPEPVTGSFESSFSEHAASDTGPDETTGIDAVYESAADATTTAAESSAVNETAEDAAEIPAKKKKTPARKKSSSPRKKKKSSPAASKMTESGKLILSLLFSDTSGFTSSELVQQSINAQVCINSGDLVKADEIINSINGLTEHSTSNPLYLRIYLKAVALYNIAMFKNAPEVQMKRNMANKALKACRAVVKEAVKVKPYYADALCLAATCYWAAGNHKKALKLWGRAVAEAEKLGARPDLARVYFAAGSCLLESKIIPVSKIVKVIGLTPDQCLDQAEILFREMDLKYDLEQLEKFKRSLN